jgi:MFS family permease
MDRSWPGYLPSLVAAVVTLVLTAVFAASAGGTEPADPLRGIFLLLLIPVPLGIAVIWGGAILASRPYLAAVAGACGWLVLSYFLLPREVVWQLAGNVAAGLAAGLALGLRWRLDVGLAVVAGALLPMIIWAVMTVPVDDQLQMVRQEMLNVLEDNLPEGATEEQRLRVLEEEGRHLDRMSELAARIYPFVIGVGLLGQAGIILALVWFSVRRLNILVPGWKWPPFSHWRLPFYLVWLLVVGLALMLTRAPYLATAGLNLALLAACVMSVQGIAVQFFVTSRLLSKMGRVLYWLVMGIFLAPLVLVSGAVIGLVDQWVDLRRLQVPTDNGNLDEGPPDDTE